MKKYGIENVRGGIFCNVEFKSYELNKIKSLINNNNTNKCYKCGMIGHYANNCYKTNSEINNKTNKCYKCGMIGHYAKNCYKSNKTEENNIEIKSKNEVTPNITKENNSEIKSKTEVTPNIIKENNIEIKSKNEVTPNITEEINNKIINEFMNPDSDLRSGRWFKNLFK